MSFSDLVGLRKPSNRRESLDDAFSRGRSIGYDEGFAQGRRDARPVVVAMRVGAARLVSPCSDLGQAGERNTAPATRAPWGMEPKSPLPWGGEPLPAEAGRVSDRVVDWMREGWPPVLAGVVGLALVAIGVVTAMTDMQATAVEALQKAPGTLVVQGVPPVDAMAVPVPVPVPVSKPAIGSAPVAAAGEVSAVAPGAVGVAARLRAVAAEGAAVPAEGAAVPAGSVRSLASPMIRSGVALAVPATIYRTTATPVVAAPAPVVAATAVPPTAAQKTAADAAAAAASTAATAAGAAAETARVAAAAAAETARVAAAAAEATRLQALADAYAVAHPPV